MSDTSIRAMRFGADGDAAFALRHEAFPNLAFTVELTAEGTLVQFVIEGDVERSERPWTADDTEAIIQEARSYLERFGPLARLKAGQPKLVGSPRNTLPSSDRFLAALAADYVTLKDLSRHPVAELAANRDAPRDTVAQWLVRARRRGLLTEPPPRKPGGRLTELALQYLKEGIESADGHRQTEKSARDHRPGSESAGASSFD